MHTASEENDIKVFGFWVYLMTDLIIFAVLFATFAVLHNNTFGGPSAKQIFQMPIALTETFLLLTSSFTCSMAMIELHQARKHGAALWFATTFLLGLAFLALEIYEFTELVHQGASWRRSGFLSSYFTLVGTHGLHISIGLLWMIVMLFRLYMRPLVPHSISRIWRMALFWHFLDFVWIFIFTYVYGMGLLL